MKNVFRLIGMLSLILASVIAFLLFLQPESGIDPLDSSQIELEKIVDGEKFVLVRDGRLFRVDSISQKWHYHDTVYQPKEMAKSYQIEGDTTYRYDAESGKRIAVRREFTESFEDLNLGVEGLRQLIGEKHGWGALTLQSPEAREVSDYVALRKRILENGESFLDASVAPDDQHVHSGNRALLCIAPAKPDNMVTCKSSISSPLVYFKVGDTFYYQAYYFVEDSLPFTIMDLECEWIKQHGGIRLCISEQGQLEAELKSLDKPRFRQSDASPMKFPMGQWVKVRTQIYLSNETDGRVKIWQDDKLVVDAEGVTLPLRSAIYSSLEVGISAHSYGDKQAKLWVDDIQVSDKPL